MALKLHVFPPSPRAFKVIALASYLGIDYENWEPAGAMVIRERLVKPLFGLGAEDPAKVAEGMQKFGRSRLSSMRSWRRRAS